MTQIERTIEYEQFITVLKCFSVDLLKDRRNDYFLSPIADYNLKRFESELKQYGLTKDQFEEAMNEVIEWHENEKKYNPSEIYDLMHSVKCYDELGHSTDEDTFGKFYHNIRFVNGVVYKLNADQTEDFMNFIATKLWEQYWTE